MEKQSLNSTSPMSLEFLSQWFWQWAKNASASGDSVFAVTLLNRHRDLMDEWERLEGEGFNWDSEKYDRVWIERLASVSMKDMNK